MPLAPTDAVRRKRGRVNPRNLLLYVPLAILLIIATVLLAPLLAGPGHVDEVTVDNTTGFRIHIDIASSPSEATTPLGTVEAHTARTFGEVLDQGDTWLFRFTHDGVPVLDVEMHRRDLEAAGWALHVPELVADRISDTENEAARDAAAAEGAVGSN